MGIKIQAYNIESKSNIIVEFVPASSCPHCHTSHDGSFQENVIYCSKIHPYLPYRIYVVHFCHACKQSFMVVYASQSPRGVMRRFRFYDLPKSTSFSCAIKELSPRFVKIYNQAELAEQENLDELSGMGYRKALEILIKDFQCFETPSIDSKIRHRQLGECISSIDDEEVKTIARGCSWLGNSQAHYVDEYEQPNNELLKRLLNVVVAFIDKKLYYSNALAIVNKKKST